MPEKFLRLLAAQLLLAGLLLALWDVTGGVSTAQAEPFANPAFQKVWRMTDQPIADGVTSRSFLWGPEGFATQTEAYSNASGGTRLVQYFDKGRMELTYPEADPNSAWFVGSGLLTRDLAAGLVQIGDNTVRLFDPARIPVAGDPSLEINKDAPVYADFSREVLGRGTSSRVGTVIRDNIQAGGKRSSRLTSAEPKINYAYYVQQSGHNIAAPFWEYFQQRGPVYTPKGGTVTASLFDWQFLMGYPLTEPYWTKVKIEGKDTETLVQLFERRVLTYTPTNPDGFKVEMGNVGRHYYQWRYGPPTVIVQDTSVPDSVGGTVTPKIGGLSTIFRLSSSGYQPGEAVRYSVTLPGGKVLEARSPAKAGPDGVVRLAFRGASFSDDENNGLGIYQFNLLGEKTPKDVRIYVRIIQIAPKTPTSPYTVDKSVPASVNAIPIPPTGPLFTDFLALTLGFYQKDFDQEKVAIWVTDPYGGVSGVRSSAGIEIVNESLEGAIIYVGSPPDPGIWAVTIQDKANPNKQSIIYIRVTEEPPELTIGAALNILTARSTLGLFNQAISSPFKLDSGE